MRPFVCPLLLMLLAVAGSTTASGPVAAQEAKAKLSPAARKELQAIAVDFRKSKTTVEQRLELIHRAGKIDPAGVEPLAETLLRDVAKALTPYSKQFMKAAATAVAQRVTADTVAEITALRAKVQEVAHREELSKEAIIETSDPALARLKELILVSRADVFAKAPELEKRRASFEPLAKQWEACAKYLQADDSGEAPSFDRYLAKEEEIATALALPMDAATRQVLAGNAQLAPKLDPEEARCILDLNITRNVLGLPPVAIDLALVATARDHSQDMEKLSFFSHESPVAGKKTPGDRAKLFGTTWSGENIAAGAIDGAAANMQWWHSPGHHKNMLGDHQRVGVGRAGRLWTEMFGN
jgi:uncharacterized protein YkwD